MNGNNAVHHACIRGDDIILRELIYYPLLVENQYLKLENMDQETPLTLAIQNNHYLVAKMLIEVDPSVIINNHDGENMFMFAAQYGLTDMAELLIRSGVDVNTRGTACYLF